MHDLTPQEALVPLKFQVHCSDVYQLARNLGQAGLSGD